MPSPTPLLTEPQTAQYLRRLSLPSSSQLPPSLPTLALLQKHQLAAIPFENLSLHYSPHRQISLHLSEVFAKIIGSENGRGGYCMENNLLFGALLRDLGFQVCSVGARVWDGEGWTGWTHMVNIVTISGQKYHVDVGFGGPGPTVPMPLDRSTEQVHPQIPPATSRLRWTNISGNTDPDQRLWVYENRLDDNSEFQTVYCFTELEFQLCDYQVMSYFTSTSSKTFFTRTVIMAKHLMSDNGELTGTLTLNQDVVKWRVKGAKEREIKLESEQERVEALEEHFGIKLSEAERDGIRGMASQIK